MKCIDCSQTAKIEKGEPQIETVSGIFHTTDVGSVVIAYAVDYPTDYSSVCKER